MKTGCGIVLQKLFPQHFALCIFDRHEGKQIMVPPSENVCLGALIEYQINNSGKSLRIHNLTPLALPEVTNTADLLFVHHVLEICYYLLPLDYKSADVFDLLILMYEKPPLLATRLGPIIFIIKLLALLGIYPHEGTLSQQIKQIISTPIDKLASDTIHLEFEQELYAWAHAGIAGNSCVKHFKTLSFLSESTRI